jgi:hypothetical protein
MHQHTPPGAVVGLDQRREVVPCVRWGPGADREDAAIVQRPGGRGQRSGRAGPNVHATGFGPTGTLDHVVRRPADWLDWLFRVGLGIKGLDGLLELTGGVLLLVTSEATLAGWVTALTQHELSEDPCDLVATSLQDAVSGLSGSARAATRAFPIVPM